jgi:hypothetical protein
VALLARRTAAHADPTDPRRVADLLAVLREAGEQQAATALNARAENAGLYPDRFAPYGREPDGRPSPPWTWHGVTQDSDQLRRPTRCSERA